MFSIFKNLKSKKSKPIIFKNRAKYNIVDSSAHTIESSNVETENEDEILTSTKRGKLLNITRNLVRNSSLFNTILGQLTTQVVSSCGGKVILNFQDDQINKLLKKYFADFTKNSGFFDGESFNHILKTVLREVIIGGDCVLLFDDVCL